jgi:hypothetical protein
VPEVDEDLASFLFEKLSERRSKMLFPVAAPPFTQETQRVLVSSIHLSAHSIETASIDDFRDFTILGI